MGGGQDNPLESDTALLKTSSFLGRRLPPLLLAALLLFLPSWAEKADLPPQHEGKPTNYAQLWIDETATVTPAAVAETLSDLSRQGSRFDHIVIMSHGFDLDEKTSTQQLEWLSDKFLREFKSKGAQKVGLVSLQWHSATGAALVPFGGDYLRKVSLARSAGRGPGRQLLLALQDKYPETHISLVGHSTGCELTTAAIVPELTYDGTEPFVETYQPQRELKILMHFLVGSDVNYDQFYTGKVSANQAVGRIAMTWQTMVPLLPEDKDEVLILRSHFIGRPTGTRFPRLTLEQLDKAVSERRWLIDSREIPMSHLFVDYFSDDRVSRFSDALKYLANPQAPKPAQIDDMDKVLAAPNDLRHLAPALDNESCGVTFYALWRIERLLCGDARHMTDETYEKVIETLRTYPQKLWRTQKSSECQTVRQGTFPTPKMMTKAGAPSWARPAKWR